MIATPCKMFLRQISPRIFLKMSFFSLHVQNPFFRRTLMILKIDTRLGSEIKSLSTQGGTVNSCTALTHPDSDITHSTVYRSTNDRARRRDGIREINKRLNLKTIKICFEIYAFFTIYNSQFLTNSHPNANLSLFIANG